MAEITDYSIRVNGGPEGAGSYHRAEVFLFTKEGSLAGLIQFYDKGQELPPSSIKGDYIEMSMPIDLLKDVVDLLRNESPVYVHWQSSIQCGFLSTGMEPTGEGE